MEWDGKEARKRRQRAKDGTSAVATLRRLPGTARVLRPGVALPGNQKEVDDYRLQVNGSQEMLW